MVFTINGSLKQCTQRRLFAVLKNHLRSERNLNIIPTSTKFLRRCLTRAATLSQSSLHGSCTTSTSLSSPQRASQKCPHALLLSSYSTASITSPQGKPFSDIPGPTGLAGIPVVGARFLFKPFSEYTSETAHLLFNSLFGKYGPIVRCQLGKQTVLVRDIKDVETVFKNEGRYPRRPSIELSTIYCKRKNIKGGFNELQGEAWHNFRLPLTKRLLKVSSPLYYLKDQNEVADDFIKIFSNPGLNADAQADIFFRYAAEGIGVVCFNTRLGFLSDDFATSPDKVAFLEASKYMFVLLNKAMRGESIAHRFYRNKTYREFEKTEDFLKSRSKAELEKSRDRLKSSQKAGTFNISEPNLVYSLLSDPTIDLDDVFNLMNTTYVAGTDSTAKNLQVFFYNLATNGDKQEHLRREILSIVGPTDAVTAEHLSEMPYLKACLKESMRLIFPNMGISRFLSNDVVLSGYVVPAGTQILICSGSVNEAYFEEPDKFLPERWLRSADGRKRESDIHPMASLPFGHGPRNCIGRRFAEQEMCLGAVKVLQKFKLEVTPESANTAFTYAIFVQPKKPIQFKLTKIEPKGNN